MGITGELTVRKVTQSKLPSLPRSCTGLKEAHGAAGKPPGNTGDVRHLVAGSDSRRTPAKGFTGEPGILLRGDKVTSRGL